ncbi:PREDICTED: pyroglutamyl-peptidase 1 isoform X3 [Myotis brandtii]|uniref:pyroglutamyl-peptidase 1 isoform X3 n=1 Tax=Myotis brandtii TaxID=109478 RepID=UPI0003BB8FE6|nr:PREDICTED: pyroglutamyl-peptidase 1 isoform X3 [Myotis brandtii]
MRDQPVPGARYRFGPFGEHTVNASWIAVQELEKLGLGDSVDLHVYEIPVEYKTVQRLIPALWEKHSPQLVVHVGVSGMATTVTLEKCGHNKGYKGLDNCRFCPGSQCCVEDGPESIDSVIDMDAVCKRVTTLGLDVSVTISQDAGSWLLKVGSKNRNRQFVKTVPSSLCEPAKVPSPGQFTSTLAACHTAYVPTYVPALGVHRYLCDFTYYTSLYQSHGRSAFVHVPPLGKPYNADQLGRALRAIIEEMLGVLEQSEDKIHCRHEH